MFLAIAPCLLAAALVGIPLPMQAAPDAPSETVQLTAVGDAFIRSSEPDVNFEGQQTLSVSRQVVNLGNQQVVFEEHALLRFDLSSIPPGSTINRAVLRLAQLDMSGNAAWDISVARITADWKPDGATWNSRPASICCTDTVSSPLTSPTLLSWNVQSLVQQWVGDPAHNPNYGFFIQGVSGSGHSRTFSSMEGTTAPELIIDFTPPPAQILIPAHTAQITLDGACDLRTEYANVPAYPYFEQFGQTGNVYFKHDRKYLYICATGDKGLNASRFFGAYLDVDNGRETVAEKDDYALRIGVESNELRSLAGTGVANGYTESGPTDWTAAAQSTGLSTGTDSAEYQIPLVSLTGACLEKLGVAVYHQDVNRAGDDFGWPSNQFFDQPQTWVEATLDGISCPTAQRVQICQMQNNECPAAAGAEVFRLNNGNVTRYTTDANGFVQDNGQIQIGDRLWARLPVSNSLAFAPGKPNSFHLYQTNGAPQLVTISSFDFNTGIMQLPVGPAHPLLVRDLDVSAQWYLQADPDDEAWLRDNVLAAANHLYDFTDGQFALGQVTVRQMEEGWTESDVKLYMNNTLYPNADIGGVVATTTVDISPVISITYEPGYIHMGSNWNKYGVPPNQEVVIDGTIVPTGAMQADWGVAMAHELGHHQFFLFDTYRDASGASNEEVAALCTGSAMGNAYDPQNYGFISLQSEWDAKCSQTEAYAQLQGRTEWDTIHTWYPWVIAPTSFVTGPVAPPVNLTSVTFVTPTVTPPNPPPSSDIFNLLYVDSETSSGEARGFVYRGNRIYEVGKPAKGSTQLELTGVQISDRLCVYDINDNSEAPDTPRHQFGCETIVLNDNEMQMTKQVPWQPEVALLQTGPQQLTLWVTQTVASGAQLMARLYPETGDALSDEVSLAGSGVYSHVFNLVEPVPAVYVQLWVNETPDGLDTRREVVADRGAGGGGAFGPAKHFGGVFVVSSDGKASFESAGITELKAGESITFQSMPGTPPIPVHKQVIGQSYRLDAYPAMLVNNGTVRIQYEESPIVTSASIGAATPAVHFWNGNQWAELSTTIHTPTNSADGIHEASAASQGIGVYAVLLDTNIYFNYLPLVHK
ncbi:MAG: DNRLRE domain-containing protein [Caldilineaceae bacterium]